MKRKQIGTYKGRPVYERDTYKQVIKRKVKNAKTKGETIK